jgi:uncharacterized iron-regulated protein
MNRLLKTRFFLILFAFGFFAQDASAATRSWDGLILEAQSQRPVDLNELSLNLVFARTVVLGEKHNTVAIQLAQAKVMDSVIALAPQDRFTTAWEFLNHTSQNQIAAAFDRYKIGQIDAAEFLVQTQGNSKYINYAPILEVTKKRNGQLIGVNLSRADKEPVVQGGLSNAKPGTVPADFELGGSGYYERFKKTMEGHATPEQLDRYYAAQCLTDDMMAVQLIADQLSARRFLVVGSFHSDYFDGTVARLMKRAPDQVIATVKFVDASDYTEAELNSIAIDPKYGPIADFVYFVNEPTQQQEPK